MSDVLPTGEEEHEELDAPEPQTLAAELGLDLSEEDRAEAEEMVARLKSQFGLDQEEEAAPEPEPPEPEGEPEPPEQLEEPEEVAQPVAAEPTSIIVDGVEVPLSEARSMVEFRRFLSANPDKAEAVRQAVEAGPAPAPAPAPEPEPPEWMDLEDPSQRFMWDQFRFQRDQIAALQRIQSDQLARSARADALSAVNHALGTFRTNHPELTEADIQTVRLHAVGLNIIPGLEARMGGSDAVLKALDLAYLDHPEFRARANGEKSPKEQKVAESKARKQKLGGLAGSSVAATRTPEPEKTPGSDREMRARAAQWLTEQGIV